MQHIFRNHPKETQKMWALGFGVGLTVFISLVMIGGSVGGADTSDLILTMNPFHLLISQGLTASFLFIGVPFLVIRLGLKIPFKDFFPKISLITALLTLLICFSFMVVNSAFAEWNMNLDFGNSSFATWMRETEDKLQYITKYIVDFQSNFHFFLALVVVALIPAIGEELLFRGILQNCFTHVFSNHHVAIWLTGIVFATIHLQFFGILPRMLLGILFGYLYHWSGKLSIAMLGHFINNGLALFFVFLAQKNVIKISSEQMEQSAPWYIVFVFSVLTVTLLRTFYKRFQYG